ncbi:MAG TPA: hypothetical protein VFX58_04285 [Chitinophagaceae bacterium]|nr:hypothetical protein [Chitinophagaceae bacterium]
MSKIHSVLLTSWLLLLLMTACKDDKLDAPGGGEAQLIVTTDAPALSMETGPTADFNLIVQSQMPPSGVWIRVEIRGELDNVGYFFSPQIESVSSTTHIVVGNLPKQKICICTVRVTSKTRAANTATTSFRIVYK